MTYYEGQHKLKKNNVPLVAELTMLCDSTYFT